MIGRTAAVAKMFLSDLCMRLIVGLWYVIVKLLPRRFHEKCGKVLGKLFLRVPVRKRKVARKNIELCFPDFSKLQIDKLIQGNAVMVGRAFFDVGIAWFWTDEQIRKYCRYRIEGSELLESKTDEPGVLLLCKHSLHFMLDARILGLDHKIYGVTRDVKNSRFINNLYRKKRLHACQDIALPDEPVKFIRWLKKGKILCFALDHDYGLKHSIIARFFDAPAATLIAPYKMRKITNCRICLLDSYYDEKNELVLQITEQQNLDEGTQELFLQRLNDSTTQQIAENPQEYHWYYGRFKSVKAYDAL